MKNRIKTIFLILAILLLLGTAFLPIIVSIATGNWWFTLLYIAIPIPLIIEIYIIVGIISVIE